MKELFIIIFSKYRRPIPRKFKEKMMGSFRDSKKKPKNATENCQYENVVSETQQQNFHNIIDNLYEDTKRRYVVSS